MLMLYKIYKRGELTFECLTVNNKIKKAMFQQKLAALETFGQIFFNGFFNYTRAGKTNKSAGLGNIKVAKHAKAGRDTAECGVG